jgi:hypothetical protein
VKKLVFLLATVLAYAGSPPDGKWTGEAPGMDGSPAKTTFEFQVDGDKLKGNVILASGTSYPIEDGTIAGDEIRFHITVKMGRDTKLVYTAKVEGDEIKFTREMEGTGRKVEFTAKPVH